jgi:hypothetical protein
MSLAPPPPPLVAEETATPPRALTPGWRLVMVAGWAMIMACVGLVANTGFILGTPPFWLPTYVTPFLLPAAALLLAAADRRPAIGMSWVASAALAVIGVVDLFVAPAMGICEIILAGLGALLTLCVRTGRVVPVDSAKV